MQALWWGQMGIQRSSSHRNSRRVESQADELQAQMSKEWWYVYVKYKSKVDMISYHIWYWCWYVWYICLRMEDNLYNLIAKGWEERGKEETKVWVCLTWTAGNSWATASEKQADKISRSKHGRLPCKSWSPTLHLQFYSYPIGEQLSTSFIFLLNPSPLPEVSSSFSFFLT